MFLPCFLCCTRKSIWNCTGILHSVLLEGRVQEPTFPSTAQENIRLYTLNVTVSLLKKPTIFRVMRLLELSLSFRQFLAILFRPLFDWSRWYFLLFYYSKFQYRISLSPRNTCRHKRIVNTSLHSHSINMHQSSTVNLTRRYPFCFIGLSGFLEQTSIWSSDRTYPFSIVYFFPPLFNIVF